MLSLIIITALLNAVNSFYLPGVAPHSYEEGESVDLKVNKLSSVHTQLPFDYYSLKFCKPEGGVESYSENLGEFLSGDRIENSPYKIQMLKDVSCQMLCQTSLSMKDTEAFRRAISRSYHNNWIVDNLPAASIINSDQFITTNFVGFPVGYQDEKNNYYIYNHVNIILDYHQVELDGYRVVGFYIEPISVRHAFTDNLVWDGKGTAPPLSTCNAMKLTEFADVKDHQKVPSSGKIIFTYGVEWQKSEILWASRWDVYLSMNKAIPDKVHWFSIVNSLLIVLFLAFMVGMILMRTVHHDINGYNRVKTSEEKAEEREESGWKLVHADVFRPPTDYPMLFCVCIGTGVQILLCAFLSIFFAAMGFLSPASRGSIMIGCLCFFVLTAFFAGYISARLFKTFKGKEWQRCTVFTALLYPGLCFSVFFGLDIIVWSYGSTGAIPVLSMFTILVLWFLISVPLVFLGSYTGYRQDVLEYPVVTSNIPRQIPPQPWYLHPFITGLVGGLLPFGACFVELFFLMSSIWMDQYYYVFGFLLIVFVILVITCAEMSIVLTYFQLCSEDYNWWWRSFTTAGATAMYVFCYSFLYFSRLESTMMVTVFLYFGYMTLVCTGLFLLTGTIGFLSSYYFNYQIYGSIKVD